MLLRCSIDATSKKILPRVQLCTAAYGQHLNYYYISKQLSFHFVGQLYTMDRNLKIEVIAAHCISAGFDLVTLLLLVKVGLLETKGKNCCCCTFKGKCRSFCSYGSSLFITLMSSCTRSSLAMSWLFLMMSAKRFFPCWSFFQGVSSRLQLKPYCPVGDMKSNIKVKYDNKLVTIVRHQ